MATKNNTPQSTLDIITDPVTGRKYSRDTSISGSTYSAYNGAPTPITNKNSTPTISTDAINTPSPSVPNKANRSETLASDLGMSVNGMTETDKKALDNVSGFVPADTTSALEKSQQSLLEKVYAGFEKLTGKKAFIKDEYKKQGLEEKQKALTGYDNQLKQEQRALEIEKRRLQENPAGVFGPNALSSQIADVERKSLQKQADIAILKSAAQGDITTAQNIIDQKVELEFGEVQDQVDLAKEYLTLIQPSLNAEEKKQAQKQSMFLDERQRLLDDEKAQKKEAMAIGLEVAKNGNSSLANQIFQLANSGQIDKAISLGISGGGLYTAPKGTDTQTIDVLDAQRYNEAYPGANIVPGMTVSEANAKISGIQSQSPDQKISAEISNLKSSGYTKQEAIQAINSQVTDPVIKRKALAELELQYASEKENTKQSGFLQSISNMFKSNSKATVSSDNKVQEGFSQLNSYQAPDLGFFGSLFKK